MIVSRDWINISEGFILKVASLQEARYIQYKSTVCEKIECSICTGWVIKSLVWKEMEIFDVRKLEHPEETQTVFQFGVSVCVACNCPYEQIV